MVRERYLAEDSWLRPVAAGAIGLLVVTGLVGAMRLTKRGYPTRSPEEPGQFAGEVALKERPSIGQPAAEAPEPFVRIVKSASPGDILTHQAALPARFDDAHWVIDGTSCNCVQLSQEIVANAGQQVAQLTMQWELKEDPTYAFVHGDVDLGVKAFATLIDGESKHSVQLGIQTRIVPRVHIKPQSLEPKGSKNTCQLTVNRLAASPDVFAGCELMTPEGVIATSRRTDDQIIFELNFDGFQNPRGMVQLVCDGRSWSVPFKSNDQFGVKTDRTTFLQRELVRESGEFRLRCIVPDDCKLEPVAELRVDGTTLATAPVKHLARELVVDVSDTAESGLWEAKRFEIAFRISKGNRSVTKSTICWWRK